MDERGLESKASVVVILVVAAAVIVGGVCLFSFAGTSAGTLSSWLLRPLQAVVSSHTQYEHCEKCGSCRELPSLDLFGCIPLKRRSDVFYKSKGFASCSHEWDRGISSAHPDRVPGGRIVLLRKEGKYGAFILRNQTRMPGPGQLHIPRARSCA